MDKIINQIISQQITCIFVSPHFDDAAFSAGGLISKLAGQVPIAVVNVFTKAGDGKDSLSAKAFLKQSREKDKSRLFSTRWQEDREIWQKLGVRVESLGFTDALWRDYPTYRWHVVSGRVSKKDATLEEQIRRQVQGLVAKDRDNCIVFCPVGIGKHVDHIVVRNACQGMGNVIFWGDFPYRLKSGLVNDFTVKNDLHAKTLKILDTGKKDLCLQYRNQVDQVVGDKERFFCPEIFFVSPTTEQKLAGGQSEAKLTTVVSDEVNKDLRQEWQALWLESSYRHYFNSPGWFEACIKAHGVTKAKIISCYLGDKLVAVLPLVWSRRFGVGCYCGPGKQFSDRSSVLVADMVETYLKAIFVAASQVGHVYLNELPEEIANYVRLRQPQFAISTDSINFELPSGDRTQALRHLNNKHTKQIRKQLAESQNEFRVELSLGGAGQLLEVISEIESESGKASDYKEVFADSQWKSLALELGKLASNDCLVSVLFYGDKAICYEYGFVCGSTWHLFQMGYKDKYRLLSPGKVLLYLTLPQMSEYGITLVDFSRGVNRLKKDFTPHYYYQYQACHSDNLAVAWWWKLTSLLMARLESAPKVYETVRHVKHQVATFTDRLGHV